jgi:Zn-dependent membrane protease YugP
MIAFGPAMIIAFVFMGIGLLVSWRLKKKFQAFSKIPSQNQLSGREIAEKMLRDHGIYNVSITCITGELTDHYNPLNHTVNLSEEVYHGTNAAAAAIAAHECGHAVQHARHYAPLNWRSKMVPLQHASGTFLNILMMLSIFGGSFLYETFPIKFILWGVVLAYGSIALFSLVTLPVEIDASKRALKWIQQSNTATAEEFQRSKTALNLAATTYVVAALGALVTMIYYLLRLLGASDE